VPVAAVDRTDTAASVVAVDSNGRLETRQIAAGIETPTRIEVLSGVHENDLVVLGNRNQLKAGSVVTPKLESAAVSTGEK
jgi:hypothetical protein